MAVWVYSLHRPFLTHSAPGFDPFMELTELFGDDMFVRLLDFFLSNPNSAFLKKEVSRRVGISKPTRWRNWGNLEKYNVVKKVDATRGRDKWALNKSSSVTKALQLLCSALEGKDGRDI